MQNVIGITGAGPIWHDVMEYVSNYYNYPPDDFIKPPDVQPGTVSAYTGLLPHPGEPPLPIGSSMARCPLYRVLMLLLFTVERISVNNNARTRDQIVYRPRKEQLPRGYCQTNDSIIHKGVQESLRG